ncbi:hypothetical protein ES288_A10G063100v1 [Gossypium darwinii]|uniref:TF-B3 domain-containing protein n=1 Tax=Gossypium darwinii TaxID=34276 RepID=A0A5D2EVK0_GOSDA|nr:hypothetical protein ES288_A10G063100v1 [Gossypium darwinii]
MENQQERRQSFSKLLTQIELENRMILFSYTEVANFFEFQADHLLFMNATDSAGKECIFVGKFHASDNVGNYVSINLPWFAVEKGLKVNDDNRPWKNFKIVIKRKIRLFGQNIWGELMV